MKNYTKTSFDKSSGFKKQAAYKMNANCSNRVLDRTFSNHVLEIDVNSNEKFIHCSLHGGKSGARLARPFIHKTMLSNLFYFLTFLCHGFNAILRLTSKAPGPDLAQINSLQKAKQFLHQKKGKQFLRQKRQNGNF